MGAAGWARLLPLQLGHNHNSSQANQGLERLAERKSQFEISIMNQMILAANIGIDNTDGDSE